MFVGKSMIIEEFTGNQKKALLQRMENNKAVTERK